MDCGKSNGQDSNPLESTDSLISLKPHTAFFDYTHRHMGRPEKDRVLVVGDSLSADITGGASFGFKTCWFNPHGTPADPSIQPDYEIDVLGKLPAIAGVGII
jgi:2-haloacid dehalogenase